jgi:DNA-binding transcriptional regulator YiaG
MPYHYKESGLDNVILQNGFTIRQTPYGETVSIKNVDALHQLIARTLIQQREINGAEFRFLRREIGKTQAQLADLFRMEEQTISLWERDRKRSIPPLAGVMLRLLYAEHIGLKPKIERTIRAQTRSKKKTVRLDRAAHRWKATEAHAY